jgi:hypothetical protein
VQADPGHDGALTLMFSPTEVNELRDALSDAQSACETHTSDNSLNETDRAAFRRTLAWVQRLRLMVGVNAPRNGAAGIGQRIENTQSSAKRSNGTSNGGREPAGDGPRVA